jgi:CspA family cold shock protein
MTTGTVKFFNAERGYGFIQPEDGSNDVFVHATALEAAGIRTLTDGQKVTFDITMDERKGKTSASNVQLA